MRTLTLILLLTSAPLACLATKCMEDCTQFKVDVPPKPESGYNTGKAVAAVFQGVMTALRATTPFGAQLNAFSYIGGGIFSSIFGLATAQEEAKMYEYKLAKGLQQTQDYLACVMEAQVSGAVYSINERMDNDKINNFNNAIQGMVDFMVDNCPAHNCLNATEIEPSIRNNVTGSSCVTAYPVARGSKCTNITWNPRDPVLCMARDATGDVFEGVCGMDNRCYWSDIGFSGTIDMYQGLKAQFLSKAAIKNFQAFNDLRNPTAVVAYAKGAMVYINVLQELHLLGSATAEDGVMTLFAKQAADWLQNRVDYHTNVNATLATVQDANGDNTYMQEPMAVRRSCKPGDTLQTECWMGCSKAGTAFNTNTQFCLFQPNTTTRANKFSHLCTGLCNNAVERALSRYDPAKSMVIRSIGDLHAQAAKSMAATNRQLFNSSGIYDVIAALREMSSTGMPKGSFAFYQQGFTPKWNCSSAPRPLLKAAAPSAPRQVEARDNLSKGSIVLRGVVIGGEKMKQLAEQATNDAALLKTVPAPAKAPVQAAPAPAKAPATTAGRRLFAQ